MGSDLWLVIRWWMALVVMGVAAWPLTRVLGLSYFFSKAVGMAVTAWIVYVLASLKLLPFNLTSVILSLLLVFFGGLALNWKKANPKNIKQYIFAELFFLLMLLFWSWVKAHEPSIRGLEKFMDYGFMQSILNSKYFPPADMWYPPLSINYYYFGHLVTAVLTKLSGLDLGITFNLMLATIFALCFTMSYSIGKQLTGKIAGGLLTAFLVTLAGNMQTIYAFTQGYEGEHVVPFWTLNWTFEGLKTYWYANATRFIPFSIHEFPSYSFVVSDVHGHVLSIPFVLLTIGLLIQLKADNNKLKAIFYGFLCGILLMTNATDGAVYLGLFLVLSWQNWKNIGIAIGAAVLASLPFMSHFNSFVNGVALNCPPAFLANTRIGPLIFEGVEKCQRSPLWMMWLLWGFFWFSGVALLIKGITNKTERLLSIFFGFSLLLIIFPEFFYFKDIYPAHFRSNTMFKLGYQAFILFSIVSGYTIVTIISKAKERFKRIFLILLIPQLFLVSIFPIFAVRSYFGGLKKYESVDGLGWLRREYPTDFLAIEWLRNKSSKTSVIVEADGDSYTDYNHFSAFTGMPTIVGWAVHEWLWRGSYEVVSPRREEVRLIYEPKDLTETQAILQKYQVKYIVVGVLERQKFRQLNLPMLEQLGKPVFRYGQTVIYEVIDR